jgi:hypothetical protein
VGGPTAVAGPSANVSLAIMWCKKLI